MKARTPLIEEMELNRSPLSLYSSFLGDDYSFWLDSSLSLPKYGRFSFMGKDPSLIFKSRGTSCEIFRDGANDSIESCPLAALNDLLQEYQMPSLCSELPFLGGAVGYLSYDLGRELEVLPDETEDDLQMPHIYMGFYDPVVAIDHERDKIYILSTCLPGYRERIEELKESWSQLTPLPPILPLQGRRDPRPISNFSKKDYIAAVSKTLEYIGAGDIFQANISQRFQSPLPFKPFDLYRLLRHKNPAPFSAYLQFPEFQVASSSPERFIELRGRHLQTRPIKGTRPRGKTPKEDHQLKEELYYSAKDRAENVMIVDLERNDFGRIASYGSVNVEELYSVEEFATVFHLVSTVAGELREGLGAVDVIKNTFPGGSITGAPKIRAMEIIEELEPVKRNVYTGSIGYLDFRGDMDLNIVIRTFILKEGEAYFQVGGGIVADSEPEKEHQETLDKAKALMESLAEGYLKEVASNG